ncbi:major facilitator family protein [Moritella sp. PE36]|uniref:sugar efflux transporter n=1 Tax=Moritella sp. PE36 TaxID=58051 RepID=UPI0001568DA4|nr:sugar efflux transporter [Moritella sp. PE36]EDM66266.1 major facilitator family protein [Moritella sp. PE36]
MFRNQTGVLFAVNGLTALAFAFVLPVMSLFLVTELNVEPAFIGIYTTLTAIMTVIVSQRLTILIDKGTSSKLLFVISLVGIVLSAIGFSLASEFWHALLIGCTLMPIASSSIPLILTIIRKYADSTGKNTAKLNSQMRSSVSLLWIFGPPLAFMSVDKLGFESNFHLAAFIACSVIVLVIILLKAPVSSSLAKRNERIEKLPNSAWFLGGVILLANIANSTYINTMPIYLTQELGLSTSYPGLLFGFTAAIEIPVMLLAVSWSQRFGKTTILKVGFISAAIFYIGMYFSSSFVSFFVLQISNGLFFGIFVGLGVTMMQDLAPKCVGKASAIYTNAMLLGTMLGTSSMGLISQYYGFKTPLLLCFISVLMSFVALTFFDNIYSVKRKRFTEYNKHSN